MASRRCRQSWLKTTVRLEMKHSSINRALATARLKSSEDFRLSTPVRRRTGSSTKLRKADGGVTDKPRFDPSEPFEAGPPPFEATQPVVGDDRIKPAFDPSKPYTTVPREEGPWTKYQKPPFNPSQPYQVPNEKGPWTEYGRPVTDPKILAQLNHQSDL